MNQHDATHRFTVYRPFQRGVGIYSFGILLSLTTVWKTGRGAEVNCPPLRLSHRINIYRCIYRYRYRYAYIYVYLALELW